MNWTPTEDARLSALVKQGGLSWAQVAAELPGRTKAACVSHANYLRRKYPTVRHAHRRKPPGVGGSGGQPRSRRKSVKVSFRLGVDVKAAFVSLAEQLGQRPGQLLELAVMRVRDPKPQRWSVVECATSVVDDSRRVAVCWCVPASAVKAAAKHLGTTRSHAAELAVLALLRAYGYTIEESS